MLVCNEKRVPGFNGLTFSKRRERCKTGVESLGPNETGFVHLRIRDLNLYFERIEGDPARPFLVFLHEGLGCAAKWKGFPRELCEGVGCPGLVYDRRGYGKSPAAPGRRTIHYLHESALVELPALLAELIPERDYWLIGHSDGGSIALIHGAERPPRLRGIVTEAAHVFVESVTLDGIRSAAEAFAAGRLEGLSKYHGNETGRVFHAWSGTWLSDWFRSWNIEYALPSVVAPVLALQGSADQYGTRAQVEAIANQVVRGEAVIVEGCGHSPHEDDPTRVIELIAGFVLRRGF